LNPASGILAGMTKTSLEKCLSRLAKVSAGTWEVLGVTASSGSLEDAVKQHNFENPVASVVYFNLTGLPLTAMLILDPADIDCISKCFMGYSFPGGPATTQAEEVMLLELGNIILNSIVNSTLNALKKSGMPSVPAYLEGDLPRLLEGLGAGAELKQNLRVITAKLAIRCDSREAVAEVLALIPEELALGIDPAQ